MSEETFSGRCLCGAIRYEVTPPTVICANCHCDMCRRTHGAAFVTWVEVKTERFRYTKGKDLVIWYRSSDNAERGFCPRCGSSIFFRYVWRPDELHVTRASFTGDIDRDPQVHVYYQGRVTWSAHDETLDKLGGDTGLEPVKG